MTSTWRDGLTMMIAICCGAAVMDFANQPWWVGSLFAVAVGHGLPTLWPAPHRGNQREETGKAERTDQQERVSRPRSPLDL